MFTYYMLIGAAITLLNAVSGFGGRIVNGTNAAEGEFPYMVSLRYDGTHACGASILNHRWILTAAHCLLDDSTEGIDIQYGVTRIDNDGSYVANLAKIFIHESWNPAGEYRNDIALLKLEEPLEYSDKVQPIRLPEQNQEFSTGESAILVGWGYRESGGQTQENLQKVNIFLFGEEECNQIYNGRLRNTEICAGVPKINGKGQCSNDSGGPLAINGVQVGIVSWSKKPCGQYPGVLTKVSKYSDWINKTVASNQ